MMKIKKSVLVLLSFIVFDSKMNAANEFKGVTFASAIRKAQDYKQKSEALAATLGTPVKSVTGGTSTQASAIRYGIAWKEEYERLKALQAANSSGYSSPIVGTPSVSRNVSSANLSGMSSPSVQVKLFPSTPSKVELETMDREQLKNAAISLQQQLEELQKKPSGSTSALGHDTTTAINVPSTQDRELSRVFNGNRAMVEAYKLAALNRNLDGFWPVVKTEVIQKLTECIKKIQPGGDDSVLLVQYASGIMYYTGSIIKSVTKGEFLRNLALRIEALGFSKITLPADSESSLTKFKSEYEQEISEAVDSLVDELVEGNDSAIVLPNELQANMQRMTRIVTADPRTKNVFKMALTAKGIGENR